MFLKLAVSVSIYLQTCIVSYRIPRMQSSRIYTTVVSRFLSKLPSSSWYPIVRCVDSTAAVGADWITSSLATLVYWLSALCRVVASVLSMRERFLHPDIHAL